MNKIDTSGRINKALERVGMFMKRVESEGKVVQFVGSERMR